MPVSGAAELSELLAGPKVGVHWAPSGLMAASVGWALSVPVLPDEPCATGYFRN